ncbi:fucose-binding lectin II [Paraburkholderia edwinii]|uniref:Fucose-binding lectin II n=2 Tax=Paraburkholderia edwinii TaxID=2861782 RepID=A0ABX8UXK3_9BURK|nr:fucose-binding lectin II [Paraburkholderia edwinii]
MFINLLNKSQERTVNAHNEANQTDAFKHVLRTAPVGQAQDITGWWRVDQSVTDKGDTDNNDDGTYNLPPNIRFAVTAIANSAAEQTIQIYVDDKMVAQWRDWSTESKNTQTQVLPSGRGKVQVKVLANGKPSLIDGRHVGMAGKTNFFLVATEDGTDNDYNDCLVVINWPLG